VDFDPTIGTTRVQKVSSTKWMIQDHRANGGTTRLIQKLDGLESPQQVALLRRTQAAFWIVKRVTPFNPITEKRMTKGSFQKNLCILALCPLLMTAMAGSAQQTAEAQGTKSSTGAAAATHLMSRDETKTILPAAVFFRGQSAPTQARNSAGVRYAEGSVVLAALVDTGGYSSSVQESYQAYLLTEVPLMIGDQTLGIGAYGFGFLANGQMVVMDIGGNAILHVATTRDDELKRPTPLQILTDPADGAHFRLYLGRNYVTLAKSK
jgi:surfactin synthase thioesterase subunit